MDFLKNQKPKCLLEINGRTILDHQVNTLREAGIEKFSLIKGYKKNLINYPGIKYYINDDFRNNNILHSLFYAQDDMKDEFIAAYSDILYSKEIIKAILKCSEDISIVVDINWFKKYNGRTDHPVSEAENVVFDNRGNVIKIGKNLPKTDKAMGEFIGIMKCTKRGAKIFNTYFVSLKKKYHDRPFQRARHFKEAYLTDMFQDMAQNGIKIKCVFIKNGWVEIDTLQDYFRAIKVFTN